MCPNTAREANGKSRMMRREIFYRSAACEAVLGELGIDDAFAFADLFLAACACAFGELFEGVDVVEVDLFDFAGGGFDVARDGDVDEEEGVAAAAGCLRQGQPLQRL
jgi:hypothetical protein